MVNTGNLISTNSGFHLIQKRAIKMQAVSPGSCCNVEKGKPFIPAHISKSSFEKTGEQLPIQNSGLYFCYSFSVSLIQAIAQ